MLQMMMMRLLKTDYIQRFNQEDVIHHTINAKGFKQTIKLLHTNFKIIEQHYVCQQSIDVGLQVVRIHCREISMKSLWLLAYTTTAYMSKLSARYEVLLTNEYVNIK